MGIHKGTKLTDTPKDRIFKFRLDAETAQKLDAVCERKRKSRSEIVRTGIQIQFEEVTREK